MALAPTISFYDSDHARLRVGRNLGGDPSAMTGGNLVKGDLDAVAVLPPSGGNPLNQRVFWPIRRNDGVSFDPKTAAQAWHDSADGVRVRGSINTTAGWSLVYVLVEEPAARTI